MPARTRSIDATAAGAAGGGERQLKRDRRADRLSVALVYDDSLDQASGVAQYVTTLGRGLAERGHHVTYLVGESSIESLGAAAVHSLARNVSVRFNGNRLTIPLASRRKTIAVVLRDGFFDVVHVQIPYSPFFAARVISQLEQRTALVGTFHIYSERLAPRVGSRGLALAMKRSLARFDRIISVSGAAAEFAETTYGVKSDVVPNMVDVTALRAMADAAAPTVSNDTRVAYIGSLVPRKAVADLVAGFALFREKHRAVLTIAGDGPLRPRLEREVNRRGLDASVSFVGRVSEAEKAQLLRRAHIACFPSRYGESFGIVVLEAIAAGAGVVIAASNRGYGDLLRECSGALFEPGEPEKLAAALTRMATDRRFRDTTRIQQETRVHQYDLTAVVERVIGIYLDTLAARRGWAVKRPVAHLAAAREHRTQAVGHV